MSDRREGVADATIEHSYIFISGFPEGEQTTTLVEPLSAILTPLAILSVPRHGTLTPSLPYSLNDQSLYGCDLSPQTTTTDDHEINIREIHEHSFNSGRTLD